jgi:hypothetical protein
MIAIRLTWLSNLRLRLNVLKNSFVTRTTMTNHNLSPATQQVLDAYLRAPVDNRLSSVRQKLAAALRAAADQVVPEEPEGGMAPRWIRQEVRRKFLAIDAELAGTTTTQEK